MSAALLSILLAAVPACAPPKPDAPPSKLTRAVLVCADVDAETFDELKARFTRLDISRLAESPECVRGKAVASEIGHTCLNDEVDCTTPAYVDGKPIATPASAFDTVVLFPQLLHGSLSAKTVTTTKVVSAGGASSAIGSGGRARGGSRGKTVTESDVQASAETDYTGEVFLFEPRPGHLRLGKQFKNLPTERLFDLILEMLRG